MGGPPRTSATASIEPAAFGAAVTRLDALGFQVHVHAIGDRAVRDALDAVEVARRANGPSDTRPQIAHLQLVHPDDLGRFRALGVVADVQAYWAVLEDQMEELTIPFVGPERAGRMYPIGSLLRAGATIAMGSDWSVSTADPLLQMEVAVERVSDEHRGRRPALPARPSGSTSTTRWPASPSARPGRTTSTPRSDRSRSARRPTSRCSIATCSTVGRVRSARPAVIATFIDGEAVYEGPELGG